MHVGLPAMRSSRVSLYWCPEVHFIDTLNRQINQGHIPTLIDLDSNLNPIWNTLVYKLWFIWCIRRVSHKMYLLWRLLVWSQCASGHALLGVVSMREWAPAFRRGLNTPARRGLFGRSPSIRRAILAWSFAVPVPANSRVAGERVRGRVLLAGWGCERGQQSPRRVGMCRIFLMSIPKKIEDSTLVSGIFRAKLAWCQ